MPGNIGPLEIGIVLIVALLVFGPKRLPELGKSLGKGIREFKGSISGENDDQPDEQTQITAADPTPPPAAQATEQREAEVVHDKSA